VDWAGSAAAVEVAGGAPGLLVGLTAVEAEELTAADDDVAVGGLAVVVDVLVVLLQLVRIMVANTTTLRSVKTLWRLGANCRAFVHNPGIRSLPM